MLHVLSRLSIASLLLAAGCAATGQDSKAAGGGAAPSSEAKGGDKKKDEPDLEKLEGEVEVAKWELQLSELSSERDARSAREEVQAKEVSHREAELALQAFLEHERPNKVTGKKIDLDQRRNRMWEAEQELEELQAMYSQEDFAKTTKELVLERGKRNVDIAKRQLDLGEREMGAMEKIELAGKERDLREKLRQAELAHQQADAKLAEGELSTKIKLAKSKAGLREKEKALEKARKDAPAPAAEEKTAAAASSLGGTGS